MVAVVVVDASSPSVWRGRRDGRRRGACGLKRAPVRGRRGRPPTTSACGADGLCSAGTRDDDAGVPVRDDAGPDVAPDGGAAVDAGGGAGTAPTERPVDAVAPIDADLAVDDVVVAIARIVVTRSSTRPDVGVDPGRPRGSRRRRRRVRSSRLTVDGVGGHREPARSRRSTPSSAPRHRRVADARRHVDIAPARARVGHAADEMSSADSTRFRRDRAVRRISRPRRPSSRTGTSRTPRCRTSASPSSASRRAAACRPG